MPYISEEGASRELCILFSQLQRRDGEDAAFAVRDSAIIIRMPRPHPSRHEGRTCAACTMPVHYIPATNHCRTDTLFMRHVKAPRNNHFRPKSPLARTAKANLRPGTDLSPTLGFRSLLSLINSSIDSVDFNEETTDRGFSRVYGHCLSSVTRRWGILLRLLSMRYI